MPHKTASRMMVIDPAIVARLQKIRAQDAKRPLMEQFHISYNTWRKLQSGEPIRLSVAERILANPICATAGDRRSPRLE